MLRNYLIAHLVVKLAIKPSIIIGRVGAKAPAAASCNGFLMSKPLQHPKTSAERTATAQIQGIQHIGVDLCRRMAELHHQHTIDSTDTYHLLYDCLN